jgi:hypothetical protein
MSAAAFEAFARAKTQEVEDCALRTPRIRLDVQIVAMQKRNHERAAGGDVGFSRTAGGGATDRETLDRLLSMTELGRRTLAGRGK